MLERFLILTIATLLTSCNKPAVTGPDAGKAYYDALNCKACHRVGAEGSVGGPDLTFVGFRRKREWLDLWLKDPQKWRPGTTMPTVGMSDRARAALVEYLSGLKGQAFAAHRPWADATGVEKGLLIYSRAGCIACHGQGGRGGYPNNNVKGNAIPSLATVSQTYKKDELARKIKNGVTPEKADPAGPEPLVFMPKWGDALSDDEIAAVVDYLFSLKPSGGAQPDF
jgi:mono/diheme cytochrome c family protein